MESILETIYGTDFLEQPGMEFFSTLLVIYAVTFGILFLYGIFCLVVDMIYAKKNGAKNWGLLLLPFGAQYVYGQLADQYEDKNAKTKYPLFNLIPFGALMVFYIGFFISAFITLSNQDATPIPLIIVLLVGYVLVIAAAIFIAVYGYMVIYRIIAYKTRENAAIWLILTILFGIAWPIFQLYYLNKPGCKKSEMTLVPVAQTDNTVPAETEEITTEE